jgi:hypothetical protein
VEAVETAEALVCAPNPTSDEATVQYRTTEAAEVRWQLVNLMGAVVQSGQASVGAGRHEVVLDVRGCAVGLYTVHLYLGNAAKRHYAVRCAVVR